MVKRLGRHIFVDQGRLLIPHLEIATRLSAFQSCSVKVDGSALTCTFVRFALTTYLADEVALLAKEELIKG